MLYLREYRPKADRLFDHLPWVALIGPGLVLNKDGGFQKTLAFRGPDLASATDAGLVATRAQLNNALRRLGSRWCLHIEALRAASQDYSESRFPDPVSALIDDERRAAFEAEERHFESRYFLTFTYLPPEEAISTAESLLRAGFVSKVEDVNAVEAWLGSLPGQAYADLRRPLVSSLNLCDMIPMSAIWPGPSRNAQLTSECAKRGHAGAQPPLMFARTAGTTPFRFDLHQGDVGHTMIVGPTGSGKSVLLNTIAMQWLRYPEAQVFYFDKGASSRASTLLAEGQFFVLGGDQTDLAFQPLADLEGAEDRAWAQDWVQDIVAAEGVDITPPVKEEIWSGLRNLASGPRQQRTLTLLAATIQDQTVKAALNPYTLSGPHGHLLDAQDNARVSARWQTFEMAELIASKAALQPVLTYIFRTLEQRFDGRPTLLVLDEAWLFLDQGSFAAKIREWLKTLRKFNVAVVFATQSLADIARSSIAPALIESCPTRIFLPNPDAHTPQIADLYASFGLNDQQLRIVAAATPKREYYYQSSAGSRLFELGLGPIALAAVGASSPGDQQRIDGVMAAGGGDFAARYYRASGFADVADFLLRSSSARVA